jgi:hypothetical protein
MGKCIEIKKISHSENIYLYHVITSDFGGADFFITIDKDAEDIYFFEDISLAKPVMKYNVHNKSWQNFFSLSNINEKVLPYVILQSYKAIKSNDFADHIGYAA